MTKSRAKPSIAKPVIDAQAAIEFVSAQHKSSDAEGKEFCTTGKKEAPAGYVLLNVPVKDELYGRLEAEARRKGKTVHELVGKLISKHISKH